jgi:hypothetical protein
MLQMREAGFCEAIPESVGGTLVALTAVRERRGYFRGINE